jgi:DNA-binding HxlR family transcriptional regulator
LYSKKNLPMIQCTAERRLGQKPDAHMRTEPVNPYHYALSCLAGKWKTSLLNHIYHYGYIRFTKTKGTFPVSEKVLSEQLKEMISDGLIERIQYDEVPLRVEYVLTDVGKKTMPAVDMLYIWSIERLRELNIDIDPDAFLVHPFERYDISMKRMLEDFEQTVDLMGLLEEYNISGDDLRKLVEIHIQREGLQPRPTPPKSPEYDL